MTITTSCSRHITQVATLLVAIGTLVSAQEVPTPSRAIRANMKCAASSADDYFVPPERLVPSDTQRDARVRGDYSRYLRAMREPSLSCGETQGEVYRLLRLAPTGAPIAVRATRSSASAELSVIELETPTWKGPGRITKDTKARLTDGQWRNIMTSVEASQFWNLETYERRDLDDGSAWILEGRRGSAYHVVERTSPQGGPFKDVCLALLRLANTPR